MSEPTTLRESVTRSISAALNVTAVALTSEDTLKIVLKDAVADAVIDPIRDHLVAAVPTGFMSSISDDTCLAPDVPIGYVREMIRDLITSALTPGAEVQAVPWWMTHLPDDWPHETRLLPHQKMWRAWIWDGDGLAGTACGNTRDEALNAALRAALGQEGVSE